ncbi:mandelate racemase/muconate lactonizing enzyme family protein [Prosthecomicrobium pneumaticum]|uniref:L-alanine-DL-glutamate epimerase-like enolase superfamily enzyme n=1 Tax=Prosthecomicrobium pneumaticum TaxID=81895 RepID=A0A7W9CUR4_9HYPH|nr:mandelate racemase/muconate lactonizing enzyme family protein [Prosthecomicrobium pneumaticum]MBB5752295.1 L-alanine-DL-glutamate epimerase-like enolase superfamily enzyme [Prosthecomicrobium pneumaticum]
MRLADFRVTRFQFRRDRVIGDSQVRTDQVHVAALELFAESGEVGLGFVFSLFHPLPDEAEIARIFREEAWPRLEGKDPSALVHRVRRPRGGNWRGYTLLFAEGIDQALWDLSAKRLGMPLWRLLGGEPRRIKAYASGLDYHLSDADFVALFEHAASVGYRSFKVKVGHPDLDWDIHRLDLLKKTVGKAEAVMIDANEAWSPQEAVRRLNAIHRAGFDILWIEDPCLRTDFAGLNVIRAGCPFTLVNSGEYLDASGKRALMEARGTDMINVHGHVTDVMRVGWLAAEYGIPVSLGNSFLEIGANMAFALPEVDWLEYSFQNFDHLVEQPMEIRDGVILPHDRPGHGLALSATARAMAVPTVTATDALPPAPANPRLPPLSGSRLAAAAG